MREAAVRLAENVYGDEVEAFGSDEPMAVGAKIAAAIRAPPAPPSEVLNWYRMIKMGLDAKAIAVNQTELKMADWVRKEYDL